MKIIYALLLLSLAPLAFADTGAIISIDQMGWRIDANIGGANASLGTTSVSSYTGIENSGLDMVLLPGSAQAEIACSSTNPSTGLTCSAGNEQLSVAFNPITAGDHEVCFDFSWGANTNSGGEFQNAFQIVQTANNSQTVLVSGGQKVTARSGAGTSQFNGAIPQHVCGTFPLASVAKSTFRVFYVQNAASSVVASAVEMDRASGTGGLRDAKVTVRRRVEYSDAVKFDLNNIFANPSRVELRTGNGSGSTRTSIRRWTNVIENVGTDITYTDSATNGAEFLINVSGTYAITWTPRFNAATDVCITKNQIADFAVACNSIASPVTYLVASSVTNTSAGTLVSKTYYFTAGTILRAHAAASDDPTNFHNSFSIIRLR